MTLCDAAAIRRRLRRVEEFLSTSPVLMKSLPILRVALTSNKFRGLSAPLSAGPDIFAAPNSIELQPTLTGHSVVLRPLNITDFESLYEVANDPLLWHQHPSPLRYKRDIFDLEVFQPGLSSKSTLVAVDLETQKIIGSSRYYDIQTPRQELAIGYTFLARSHWGGRVNAEIKSLMLRHAFTWAKRVWFHIAKNNFRSRKAIEKIGAQLSHLASRPINGQPVEHCYYYIDTCQSIDQSRAET